MTRRLGLWSAAALVVANMIGSGVYTVSGFALADLGRPSRVLLAWIVGGGFALCGALSYGALGRYMPLSGGEYTFLARTLHPLAGLLAGWVSLLAGFTAPIAASALALDAFLIGSDPRGHGARWVATAAIGFAGLLHGARRSAGVWIQNASVVLKLLLIIGFLALGAHTLPGSFASPAAAPAFDWTAFGTSLVFVSFAYSGWNAAVYVAGEIADPARTLSRALVLASLVVTVVYVGLNAVFLAAAPVAELSGRPEIGAVAAQAIGGDTLRRMVTVTIALALWTSLSSMVMAGPRVYARMAADGFLPSPLARTGDTPLLAVAFQVALAIAAVWTAGLAELLGYAGFLLGLSAAGTVATLIWLREREGAAHVPIPGHPIVPGVFVAGTLGITLLMALHSPRVAALGLLSAVFGLPLYWLRGSSRSGDGSRARPLSSH